MMVALPADFPPDLREALGLDRLAPRPLPSLAPITPEILAALDAARKSKGKCI